MHSLQFGSLAGLIPDLIALAQVLFIDLVLAGDNAVVVGMAVAGLPPAEKRRAMIVGIAAATVIRIGLATIALQLLAIVGLMLAGGILLLWVCWRMYREIRPKSQAGRKPAAAKSVGSAMVQIVLADLSMSLDNVLAVAGAADGNFWVLATGLVVSIVLMAVAASLIARLLERRRWIAWVGLVIVLFVAVKLIWEGGMRWRRLGRGGGWDGDDSAICRISSTNAQSHRSAAFDRSIIMNKHGSRNGPQS